MPEPYRWVVVVPVKAPARAKSRLTEFSVAERASLATAFALDVIAALMACEIVKTVRVITDDVDFGRLAKAQGCEVIADETTSLNDAIVFAAHAPPAGATEAVETPVAVAVSDLPCASAETFTRLFTQCETALFGPDSRSQAFVSDQTGRGTTFLAARTASELKPLFGPESAAAHRENGVWALEIDEPGLRLDVDTAADLAAALTLGVGPHTASAVGNGWSQN